MLIRRFLPAILLLVTSIHACDYFLQGTYTGLCDEPSSLYDGGDPERARRAQCQVMGNVCCRRLDPSPATGGLGNDLRTRCLQPHECYRARHGEACYGDVDCEVGLACVGGSVSKVEKGSCRCPADGIHCLDTRGEGFFCCEAGLTCNQGSCVEPPPRDMAVLPDLRASGG